MLRGAKHSKIEVVAPKEEEEEEEEDQTRQAQVAFVDSAN